MAIIIVSEKAGSKPDPNIGRPI